MRSIRTKILLSIISIVLISLSVVGVVSSLLNYRSTYSTLEETMIEAVEIAANQVSGTLDGYKRMAVELAANPTMTKDRSPVSDKIALFQSVKNRNQFLMVEGTGKDGIGIDTATDYSKQEFFLQCRQTEKPFISDPMPYKDGKSMIFYIAAPILKVGEFDGVFLLGLDAEVLSQITDSIQVGTGNTKILNKDGVTIAFFKRSDVQTQYSTQTAAKSDPKLARLGYLEEQMCAGVTDFQSYTFDGQKKSMAYAPIPDSNGWSIDISIVESEFLRGAINSIYITGVLALITILVSIFVAFRLATQITKPLKASVSRLRLLADGDLQSPVPALKTKDETRLLRDAMSDTIESLWRCVSEIEQGLGEISRGNLNAPMPSDFDGDFSAFERSMAQIVNALNCTLYKINQTADLVAGSSEQVSNGAQSLSQGAAEQASSIEELSAAVTEISEKVQKNAVSSAEASGIVEDVSAHVELSNRQMQAMIAAMGKITNSSNQISKIIKTIDDIAFQTNILALNASVEAARAGNAGKGFAVVANEVRSLASKSAEAARNTSQLIEDSVQAVKEGSQIAGETANSLSMVVDGTQSILRITKQISYASNEQSEAIQKLNSGIDLVASVVLTNSATAQESAAAAEELSSQAQMLRSLVGQFQLNHTALSAQNQETCLQSAERDI